ncbi:hypothetical protein [Micromonospora sp. RP3T]|uniref:hypothetical protein n=1 Tax=Micromonospora sp. RP3T TaxID=2135446 RepID=UPI003D72EDEB
MSCQHCCPQPSRADILAAVAISHTALHRLENTMATVVEVLETLTNQQTATSEAQRASFANLQAAISDLTEAVRNGEVSPEIQAAADRIAAGFDQMKNDADAADDGYERTPTDPGTEPTDPTLPGEGDGTEPGDPDTFRG